MKRLLFLLAIAALALPAAALAKGPSEASITGPDTIEVWSDDVKEPVAVRYAWADNPVCNVFNDSLLPLTPFRTDDWDGVTKGKLE